MASAGTVAYCSGARVTEENVVASTKFLQLAVVDYFDDHGVARKWEMVQRVGTPAVVSVVPILNSKEFKPGEEETLLTCQFRPALRKYCLEFPAALCEGSESVEECAKRLMANETGYACTVRTQTPPVCTSAGLTNEVYNVVVVDVNLDDYVGEETTTTKTIGRRRRKLKKTTKVKGESWIPDQGELNDDQNIAIKKIKVVDLPAEIEAAHREGIVPAVSVEAVAMGMALSALSSGAAENAPAKKGWF